MTARRAHLLAAVLVAAYLAIQLAGLRAMGLTDDDDFYIPAGISYAEWLGKAATLKKSAFTRQGIDAAFTPNHEHPPLAKYVFGVSHALFGGILGPTDGARVGAVLFSTLLAAVLLWMAIAHLGPARGLRAGGLAALFLLLLPRFYFHSHAATLDVPVAAMYALAAATCLAAERSRKAALLAGVAFGLASATKLNAPFLVVPYLAFVLLTRRGTGRALDAGAGSSRSWRLPQLPLALVSMAVIGPLVFLASWPWLWFDTFKRIGAYVGFHLNHYGIHFLYFGTVYTKDPFAPWHSSFVMAAVTTPLAISALALLGLYFGRAPVLARLRFTRGPDDDVRREGDLVLSASLHAVVAVAVVAFSGGAKYGGEKLFAPFFPFWCLLAGYGASRLYEHFRDHTRRPQVAVAAVALAVASALALTLKFGSYSLSAYNGLAGGARGATALGFERQYYDVAFRDLVAWLNEHAPQGARVHFLPNNWEYIRTYKWYRQAGELRADITVVNGEREAQLLVLTHERRFARYGADLERYRHKRVLAEKVIDGAPIWTVLEIRP